VALAEARVAAAAMGVAVVGAFFARGPVEQLGRARPARYDRAALLALAIVIAVASLVAGQWRIAVAPAVAVMIIGASLVSRQRRVQRTVWFEAVGMAALGAVGALIALAGGAPSRTALCAALILAVHAGTAVPLVRAEARPRERPRARAAAAWTL